jgi:hypothetical protein
VFVHKKQVKRMKSVRLHTYPDMYFSVVAGICSGRASVSKYRRNFLKSCPGWGANPGSFGCCLFSHHTSAEPQRLPGIEGIRTPVFRLHRLEPIVRLLNLQLQR